MINLTNLTKINQKRSKRLGRGQGSGKSKTAGRGTKGQNARSGLSITHSHYEGGQRPLMKRLPYLRGKGNPKVTKKPLVINIEKLIKSTLKSPITIEQLIQKNLVSEKEAESRGVKILGTGKLVNKIDIILPTSKKLESKLESKS